MAPSTGTVQEAVHAVFSPSSAHRWMECPGSMAYLSNRAERDAGKYAAEGTAAHFIGSEVLKTGKDPSHWHGKTIYVAKGGGALTVDEPMEDAYAFVVDDDMVLNVGVYTEEIWRRMTPNTIKRVEQRTNVSNAIGIEGQFGTSDCVLIHKDRKLLEVHDLKFGRGEMVYAKKNHQLLLYAAGELEEYDLLYDIDEVLVAIHQPRLNHFDEFRLSVDELCKWLAEKRPACADAQLSITLTPEQADAQRLLRPGEKTCRWCEAKAVCPALARFVQESVKAEFEEIPAEPPLVPVDLESAIAAVPLIEEWCKSVVGHVMRLVQAGEKIVGSDGLPMKLVQGRRGKRAWADELLAEAALAAQLGPKAYAPRKIITAAQAAKYLDKKATKNLWHDQFEPLIKQSHGKPQLALGSDERPPYTGAADADEFDDEGDDE